jgi:hypothetical protein
MASKRPDRPMIDILLELEVLLDEIVDDHGLEMGDILNLIRGHLEIHRPDCIEQYLDGSVPVFYYGHKKIIDKK